jgi:hypothetical protein
VNQENTRAEDDMKAQFIEATKEIIRWNIACHNDEHISIVKHTISVNSILLKAKALRDC